MQGKQDLWVALSSTVVSRAARNSVCTGLYDMIVQVLRFAFSSLRREVLATENTRSVYGGGLAVTRRVSQYIPSVPACCSQYSHKSSRVRATRRGHPSTTVCSVLSYDIERVKERCLYVGCCFENVDGTDVQHSADPTNPGSRPKRASSTHTKKLNYEGSAVSEIVIAQPSAGTYRRVVQQRTMLKLFEYILGSTSYNI